MDSTKVFFMFFVSVPLGLFFCAAFVRGMARIALYVLKRFNICNSFLQHIVVIIVSIIAAYLMPVTVVIGGIDIVKTWKKKR